ncbi:beta-ketoacyl-[acyl-carrier-protein] synthase II [Ktedonobacteria bacterium brp13]|nr:beta-ketoacyl-[acyl-carrier-protein] synthase II [Ktedonobacteria bacterium brp13]
MAKYDGPIVITGTGAVSPFGLGSDAVWSALLRGERQTTVVEQTEPYNQTVLASKVGALPFADLLGKRGLQYLRPCTQFLLGASTLAIQAAGLADGGVDPDGLGVTVGCNLGGLQSTVNYDYTAITEGPHYVSPMEAPNTLANAPASRLAMRLSARALNTTISSGQCAGLDALGYAAKAVREGRARQIVSGGVEELSPAVLWLYRNSKVLSNGEPADTGHPFDSESTGWLPGEGAAVVVLERHDDAVARGARPLAELAGWSSAFAPSQDTEKRSTVLARTARQALKAAGLSPEDVDVVVSGANGLQEQDQVEALALHTLFAHNTHVCVTAIKGTLGETYGASGLFQTLAAVYMLDSGLVPPTIEGAHHHTTARVDGLLTKVHAWPESKQGTTLLLAQDIFGSTSAVVLRGCQE